MDPTQRQTIGRMILGTGMAGKAADKMQMHPIWKNAVINGETNLQFEEWLKQHQMQQQGTVGGMVNQSGMSY